jgi:hypothetical protein
MKIAHIISRHRNDFAWMGECSCCGHRERYGDGYADHYYVTKVAPARFCPKCDVNCLGETRPAKMGAA